MVFVKSIWFNQIGLILVQDLTTLKYKAYIGCVKFSNNFEKDDVKGIMTFGDKFPLQEAASIMGFNLNRNFKEENIEKFL